MARRTSIGKKLLLLVATLVLALLAAEGVCRLAGEPPNMQPTLFTANGLEVPVGEIIVYLANMADFDSRHNLRQAPPHGLLLANLKMRMGYKPKPIWDYFDETGCVAVDTNSLGLRDEEFPVEKRPGELRILAIGDSMTYGMGVRLDLTWPQVLEARLRAERSGPVEVINAGFAAGGYSPAEYDRWVEEHGVLFDPDIVIIGVCLNDVHSGIGMLTYPKAQLEPVLGGFSLLLDRAAQLVRQSQLRAEKRDLAKLITPESAEWKGTRRGLRAIRDTLAEHGIELVVAVFPMMSQLEPELYPCRHVHELVTAFCHEEGIRCLDLLPAFLGMDDRELWVHASDQHANDKGHAIQAAQIHAFLGREGLLSR
ncbi:MAG: SGNH/GDSL hydrolase family protein [Planctomycetes bacterium]|nr:SGNH/GDSL hydrolase family protein [Planctomycetota bacterium]